MIPILFSPSATTFTSNGLGRLSDAIECTVEEQRNGLYELEMRYPMTGRHYAEIENGSIIVARHCDKTDLQPFRVYKITRPLNGIVTIYAQHISYDLTKIVVTPFTAPSITQLFQILPAQAVNSCPFTFWTDKTVLGEYKVAVPSSIRSLLGGSEGSILDIYGTGEYEFDGYTVKLHLHRGTNHGVTIRYGKNMTELVHEGVSTANVTAVLPYWTGTGDDGAETTVYTLSPVVSGLVAAANYVNEGDIAYMDANGNIYQGESLQMLCEPLDLSDQFETAPTEAQLIAAAEAWLADHATITPTVSMKVSFVQLWQTNEYKAFAPLQRVALCDTVNIQYPKLGVTATAEVVKVVYNVLLERYDSMELGTPKTTLAASLAATEQAVTNIANSIDGIDEEFQSMIETAITAATDLLSGGLGGHVVLARNADGQPNEILVMDTDNIATAMNVLRINMNGIGFSSSGYDGPYGTAWTLDGRFVADYITAGKLRAITIEGPTPLTFWDLATGIFQNYGQSTVTAQVETAEGVYTPTNYTLAHKIRIAQGLLKLLASHSGGTELPYVALGLAAQGMAYEFYEGIAGSGESTSYPFAGLDLYGDTVSGMSGGDVEYDGRSATYNPAGHYTPDYWEIGGADNLSTGSNQYPDRNQLRAQAGWGNHENAIEFIEHYKWEETPSGVRRQFHEAIRRRPSWEYAVDDNVEYPNTTDSRIICSGYLTDDRTTVRFQINLPRPFHSDVTDVEVYGELKIRLEGSYIAGSGGANADFADYDQVCAINASGISVRLKKPNNATWSSGNNNHDLTVDIYGLGIICSGV